MNGEDSDEKWSVKIIFYTDILTEDGWIVSTFLFLVGDIVIPTPCED